jgi:hypothetical protein
VKTLEEFELVRDFLGGQGLKPTTAMICVSSPEWQDLVYLAKSWRTQQEEEVERMRAELDGLSEEELAMRERAAEDERRRENERVLFHSSGYRPEK